MWNTIPETSENWFIPVTFVLKLSHGGIYIHTGHLTTMIIMIIERV